MANKSKIQWTDATWNIARGCTKVNTDCKYCYMYRDSYNETRYKPKDVVRTKTVFDMPLKLKEPSRIFTCSLTDFFHPDIDEYRDEAWEIIRKCPQHTFQILTKRPERILDCLPNDWGDGYDNVWLGVSCGHQKAAKEMIPKLMRVNTKIRFASIEPLTELVSITNKSIGDGYSFPTRYFDGVGIEWTDFGDKYVGLDWIIVGGESGNETGKYRYRPSELDWYKKIVDECKMNRVPVFVKQLGTHLAKKMGLKDRHGGNIDEFPKHLQIRQFPTL